MRDHLRRYMPYLFVGVLLGFMVGCGDATVPLAPDPVPTATPAPQQRIISLAFSIRSNDGRLVEFVGRDDLFTIESGPRCLLTELPCPRPSRVLWRVSGAFCEILGDITGPAVTVTCAGGGVTRVDAEDLDSGAKGTAQIQVRF